MFKVGDRVKSKRSGATGTVVEVTGMRVGVKTDDARKGTELNTDIGNKRYIGLYLPESEWEKINDAKKILITHDGHTTLARLYDGNAVVKSAEAKCAPSDTFDFMTGAKLVFERLVKEDKPTEQSEPVKLYCTADGVGMKSLKKGDICQWSEAESKIIFPDGQRSNLTYSSWKQFFDSNLEYGQARVIPLVSRPAKVGEYILVIKHIGWVGDGRYEIGDILKVTKDDTNIIEQWVGKAVGFENVTRPERPWQHCVILHDGYLVIDGYQPEPERCECCGRVIGE